MLTNEVDALVHGIAIQVARRYRTSSREDLLQQGRLWVLAHPKRMDYWLEQDDAEAWRRIDSAVRAELECYARYEKAARTGYALEDEAYYSTDMIEELLPAIFDPDREAAPVMERQEVRAPSDPAISAVWPCHLADVSAALDRSSMPGPARVLIGRRYEFGMSDPEIAEEFNITTDEVASLIHSGLQAMIGYLGGSRPSSCTKTCPECHGSLLTVA